MTLGQTITFLVMVCLYVSSAAYHTWRPSSLLRVIDQTMISWFIVTVPLPWLYREHWFQVLWLFLLVGTASNAWYHPGPLLGREKITFLALGTVSALLILLVGLPEAGESVFSRNGALVWITIFLYLGKLYVYHRQWKLVVGYIEAPELGHWLCGMGTTTYALLIAGIVS